MLPGRYRRSGGRASKRISQRIKKRDYVSNLFTVGLTIAGSMEDEKLGGLSTPSCGGVAVGAAGRRPVAAKNANMDVCVFCFLAAPDHGEGAAPPPLSRLKDGFATGT